MRVYEPGLERLRSLWRRPCSFTAFVPIPGVTTSELNLRLRALAPQLESALSAVTDLHTLRLVALPSSGRDGSSRILFNSVRDRSLNEHFTRLVAVAGPLLSQAFAGADYSGRPEDVPRLLVRFRKKDMTVHLGAINKGVADIQSERRLLAAVEELMDEAVELGRWPAGTPAETIRQELRANVLALPDSLGLPTTVSPPVPWFPRLLRFLDLLVTFAFPAIGVLAVHIQNAIKRIDHPGKRALAWLAYGLWWIYGAVFTGMALLVVRVLELIEPDVVAPSADPAKVAQLESTEDLTIVNQVTYWFPVKPTCVRRLLLRVILWGSERGCRHFWTNGSLAGINTIHYARILEVDDGATMLFLSDYDGSLDRYLLDFLGVGSDAVIPIASNVYGCPKTRWLFTPADPGTFGPRLMSLLRLSQLETPVWYRAYPNLTVDDTLKDGAIRDGLFAPTLSEKSAADWLAQL
ncbi:MAG TPA: hypothetical protein VGL42_06065 [Opitutaceae bacterium]|jgi:hypothetical protein